MNKQKAQHFARAIAEKRDETLEKQNKNCPKKCLTRIVWG